MPRRRGGHRRPAGAVSVPGQHLQRREAERVAGRARVVGAGVAGDRHRAAPRPIGAARRPARRPRRRASDRPRGDREIRVTVVNDTPGAADSVVRARGCRPAGPCTPAEQTVKFDRTTKRRRCGSGEARPPRQPSGEYHVRAVVTSGGRTFTRGYQVIEYPHIRRYHILRRCRHDLEGDRREDRAEPDDRLHHGRGRPGAAGHRAARREGADASAPTISPGATCRRST